MSSKTPTSSLPSPLRIQRSTTSPAKTTQRPSSASPLSPPPASPPQARRSISFHVRSRDIAEGHRMRWDADMEARLQAAEAELKLAQRSWSARQEVWIEEVESLRELKKESEKFYQRRRMLMRKEGSRWWKGRIKDVGSGSGGGLRGLDDGSGVVREDEVEEWSGMEDEDDEGMRSSPSPSPTAKSFGVGALLQRITGFPLTGLSTPDSTSQSSSRKSSLVGNLMKGGIFKRRDSV